jgi:VWFA-related protein
MQGRKSMRRLLCFLLALPLLGSAQAPAPTIRTTTSEVLLDFVVRDKQGKIVRDLRPEEVQVFEDGVQQTQRYLQFFDGQRKVQETSASDAAAVSPGTKPDSAEPSSGPRTVNELRDISVISVIIGNLDPRGRKITLDAMRKFAKSDLDANTYVGVFTLGMAGLRNLQPYTNDAAKVSTAVEMAVNESLNGQFMSSDQSLSSFRSPGAADDNPGLLSQLAQPADPLVESRGPADEINVLGATLWVSEMQEVYNDSMRALAPLRALVQAQSQIPGRKVMLLFSAGLPVQAQSVELLRSVISAANRANVSIYALDTRGTTPADNLDDARRRLKAAAQASMNQQMAGINGSSEVSADQVVAQEIAETSIHSDTRQNMAELAEGTGGALLPDTLDLREPIREAVESARMHYDLTYAPSNATIDGGFRRIEVKVSRPGVHVFARSGYFALPVVNGQQVYPFEMATMKALHTRPDLHQFDFRAAALEFRSGPARTQMEFVFQAPTHELAIEKDAQWAKVHVCVTTLIRNEKGEVTQKISKDIPYEVPLARAAELENGSVSFTSSFLLPPGHYTVETATVDRQSMKASVSRAALVVKQDSGFAMSDVSLVRRVDPIQGAANPSEPLQSRGGSVTPELSDIVPPDAGGKATLYAIAYPQAPVDEPVNATLAIWRGGEMLMRSPAIGVPLDANGAASILASLRTDKLPPGQYQAQVSFEYKGQSVAKMVAFTLAEAR